MSPRGLTMRAIPAAERRWLLAVSAGLLLLTLLPLAVDAIGEAVALEGLLLLVPREEVAGAPLELGDLVGDVSRDQTGRGGFGGDRHGRWAP